MNKVMRIIKEKKLEKLRIWKLKRLDYRLVKSDKNAKKKCRNVFDIFNSIFEIDIKIKE
jgi:hypothetical protein